MVAPKPSTKRSRKPRKPPKKRKKRTLQWVLLFGFLAGIFMAAYWFGPRIYKQYIKHKPCLGEREYTVCLPLNYTIHGIDVSNYQGIIDWELLKTTQTAAAPLHFVFLKATEGANLKDLRFDQNFKGAKEAAFLRGAYHFYNPNKSPEEQANFYIQTVPLERGDLPPVLDIERKSTKGNQQLVKDLKVWLTRIEAHYRVKPIIYASYSFKKEHLKDPFFDAYPYWIAHYYIQQIEFKGDWFFWQHTDMARLPGIKGDVDLNVFNGNLRTLKGLTIQ